MGKSICLCLPLPNLFYPLHCFSSFPCCPGPGPNWPSLSRRHRAWLLTTWTDIALLTSPITFPSSPGPAHSIPYSLYRDSIDIEIPPNGDICSRATFSTGMAGGITFCSISTYLQLTVLVYWQGSFVSNMGSLHTLESLHGLESTKNVIPPPSL